VTPNQTDKRCSDPGPELVDAGDFGRVEGAKASEVFEAGVGFASFTIGFFEPSSFIAFRPAIRAFGDKFWCGTGGTANLPGVFTEARGKFR